MSSSSSQTRILLVDDVGPCREMIHTILQEHADFVVVGEAVDGLEAVEKAQQLDPDVILLDIGLPGINGLEAAREIRRLVPGAKIVFVSQNTDADVIQAAISSGAQGFVRKAHAARKLLPAIEAVLRGEVSMAA